MTCSTIFDLTSGEVYIHFQHDLERPVKINLKEELDKGERSLKIASLQLAGVNQLPSPGLRR